MQEPNEDARARIVNACHRTPLKEQKITTGGLSGSSEKSRATKTELTLPFLNHLYGEAAIWQNASCCPLRSRAMVQSLRAVKEG